MSLGQRLRDLRVSGGDYWRMREVATAELRVENEALKGEAPSGPCPTAEGGFSCRFCRVHPLHRGDEDCACSELRPDVTAYSTLCPACAATVDLLTADTPLGRVHRALVYEARLTFVRGDDD